MRTDQLVKTVAVIVIIWLLYLMIGRLAQRSVGRFVERGGEQGSRAMTLWSMLRRLVIVVLTVTALLTVAAIWEIPQGPFLAVGSAVGVAIGFGAQDLVRDVISGFFILAEDQFHIGDVVRVADVAGAVEDIRPRVTVLRDLDGNVHYVPNGQIKVASNLTQRFAQVVVDVGVAYKVDVDRALEVLGAVLDEMQADDRWGPCLIEPPQVLGVDQLADSAVVLRAVVKVEADERWNVRREALRRVKNRFDAEGIEIPYPHLTVYRGD
jgi:small conductance mechanosensitive channel